jgi:hypothetical protein
METTSGNQRSRDYYSIARRGKNTFAQFIDLLDGVSLGTWQGKLSAQWDALAVEVISKVGSYQWCI